MTQHTRTTFTRARDLLAHSVQYLRSVRDLLDDARGREHSERVQMLLTSFETEQRNLLGALERYQQDAAARSLDTFAQYSVELPEPISGPDEPLSTLTLTQWLLGLNQHLIDMFEELGEHATSTQTREMFGALAEQVRSHDRRLSKEYQRFEDL